MPLSPISAICNKSSPEEGQRGFLDTSACAVHDLSNRYALLSSTKDVDMLGAANQDWDLCSHTWLQR